MNIWSAFFLVVSIVILAAPVLLSGEPQGRNGSGSSEKDDNFPVLKDDELELDLACGRVAREDYEDMSERRVNATVPDGGARGNHGSASEG